ncbi:MAG: hypothetical protein JST24_11190 [Acidobacteria bacterium]|nr:hypothetical protein [Acidobacteriota bacterium]
METLYDHVLGLLRGLRGAGRAEDADALLAALTQACNPREVLSELRYAVSEVDEAGLSPELVVAKRGLLDEVEAQWKLLP